MKKVLVISYYFPPVAAGSVLRPLKFVKYFPKYGWKPFVVTVTPNNYYAKDEDLINELNGPDVRIYRTPSRGKRNIFNTHKRKVLPNEKTRQFFFKLRQVYRVPDSVIKWKKKALKLASEIIEKEKIDILFSTAPPFTDFLIANELKKKYNIPLVIDYRDSWIYSPSNFYLTPIHKFSNSKKELEIIRKADVIFSVNRRIKELLIETYQNVRHADVNVIPHGFDQEDFDKAVSQLPRTNKMRITHAGTFFENTTPEYFLEGLSIAIAKEPELAKKLEACFLGVLSKKHIELFRKYKLQGLINAPGYVNHHECIKYLVSSDVLWFMIGNREMDQIISPVKLSEYIGARKPVLACVPDGAAKSILRFYEAVKICDPQDSAFISKAILEYYDLFKKNLLPKPDEDLVSQYDVEKLTYKVVRYFEFLIDIPTEIEFVGKKIGAETSST